MTAQVRAARLWARLPLRTVRARLTLLYAGTFLVSGIVLLTITDLLVVQQISAPDKKAVPPGTRPRVFNSLQVLAAIHQQASQDLHRAISVSGIALALTLAASAVLGWLVAGRALRPLQHMTATARQISEHSLHDRLPASGPPDELTDLAGTVNALLARLEAAFDAQRRFAANASHELRTPLAMMRTSVDVAITRPGPVPPEVTVLAAKLREGLDQATRLLESLLALARAEYGAAQDDSITIPLGKLLADAIEARRDAIARSGLRVSSAGGGTRVKGNSALLTRMIENLIDNAIRHNQRAGWIRAEVRNDGPAALVTVENSGQILSQDTARELTKPFRRLDGSRTGSAEGSGLGLSIVKAIALAHGGSIQLHALPQGGLRVTIKLHSAQGAGSVAAQAGAQR